MLDSVCNRSPIIRPAHLARLSILRNQTDQVNQESLLEACKDYAQSFSEKAFCFDDLKESLRRLDQSHRNAFIHAIQQTPGIPTQLFILKVVYGSIHLATDDNSTSRNQELLAFAYQTLKVYQKPVSGPHACPEAALLAALAFLHLRLPKSKDQNVLIATTILELARSRSEDYYILTVLLVQLQAHLGLLSLAMQNYMALSVKNMQWETVGHLLLSRISALHPASTGDMSTLEPLMGCEQVVSVLQNSDTALVRGIREGLRFNSYSNIYNSVKMRSEIERSMSKQICAIEGRKLTRWRGLGLDHHRISILPDSKALVDNRDFSYLPSYREDDRRILARYRCGELPKDAWIDAMTLSDNVATYLKAELSSHASLATTAYKNLKRLHERFPDYTFTPSVLESEMTECELLDFGALQVLARAIIFLNDGITSPSPHHGQISLPAFLDDIRSALESALDRRRKGDPDSSHAKIAGIRVPTHKDLHASFSLMERLQTTSHFLTWVLRRPRKSDKTAKNGSVASVSKEEISRLQGLVAELEAQVHCDAQSLSSQINQPGVLGKLVDLCMARRVDESEGESESEIERPSKANWIWNELDAGSEWETLLEELSDEAAMETICGKYRESWDDALNGILVTKVGQ